MSVTGRVMDSPGWSVISVEVSLSVSLLIVAVRLNFSVVGLISVRIDSYPFPETVNGMKSSGVPVATLAVVIRSCSAEGDETAPTTGLSKVPLM